jgi:hypothetical protein
VRSFFVASSFAGVVVAVAVACDSFEEGELTPGGDASTSSDAPAGESETGTDGDATTEIDATVAPFCDSPREAGVFCFDFDTTALAPTWTTLTFGQGLVALDDKMAVSPPRSVALEVN